MHWTYLKNTCQQNRRLALIVLLSLTTNKVFCQNNAIDYGNKEIGLQIGGENYTYSIFYQHGLWQNKNIRLSVRLGFGALPIRYDYVDKRNAVSKMVYKPVFSYSITPNISYYKRKHTWEAGIGFTQVLHLIYNVPMYYNYRQYTGNDHKQLSYLNASIAYKKYFANNKLYIKPSISINYILDTRFSDPTELPMDKYFFPWAGLSFGHTFKGKKEVLIK